MKTVTTVHYVVIAAYMALMLAIGFYSARFNRGAADCFKGGNRIPWLVAGLSCFMSGFSAWTFTGAADLAMSMAARGASIFQVMPTFNTVMALAYGPPALLGLVVKRTPSRSGMSSFLVDLVLGGHGAFVTNWSLVQNVAIIVPASFVVFFAAAVFEGRDAAHAGRRDALFRRLGTPVDVPAELRFSPDPTATVFRFLARTRAGVGIASLLLIASGRPGERVTVIVYVGITLAIAAALTLVRGAPARAQGKAA